MLDFAIHTNSFSNIHITLDINVNRCSIAVESKCHTVLDLSYRNCLVTKLPRNSNELNVCMFVCENSFSKNCTNIQRETTERNIYACQMSRYQNYIQYVYKCELGRAGATQNSKAL